jgi:hypothetical protein
MIRPLRFGAAMASGSALLVALAAQPALAGGRSPADRVAGPSFSASPSAATTATAAPAPGPAYVGWNPAACATGGFGPLEVDAGLNVVVPGQATICGKWAGKYAFTVVAFRPDRDVAFAFPTGLRPYAETGPTEVRAAFVTPPGVGSTGVCLMRSTTVRLACLAVDVDAQHRITARPVATDDPLVARPVSYQGDAVSPDPGSGFCATCVDLP